jgi:hypothetical protein
VLAVAAMATAVTEPMAVALDKAVVAVLQTVAAAVMAAAATLKFRSIHND